ncbi:hypothetical protein [Streptomyces sp. NPDC086023]|uniref:hypothetical protein n=1 Tax=Streptomyces sp. NPDC086023 TaxID=3365746 RepID=UPI0037CF413C
MIEMSGRARRGVAGGAFAVGLLVLAFAGMASGPQQDTHRLAERRPPLELVRAVTGARAVGPESVLGRHAHHFMAGPSVDEVRASEGFEVDQDAVPEVGHDPDQLALVVPPTGIGL